MYDKQKEEMERLFESFIKKLAITNTSFVRSLMNEIEWEARLIGIKGARGVGKTTLLLQYIKLNLPMDKTVLYASVDNIWFSEHKLYDLASDFVKRGGKYLFLDDRVIDKGILLDVFIGSDNAYSYTQYFKMRGYYAAGGAYETWTSANLPNLNPPSGHTLTDIVIVAVWFA